MQVAVSVGLFCVRTYFQRAYRQHIPGRLRIQLYQQTSDASHESGDCIARTLLCDQGLSEFPGEFHETVGIQLMRLRVGENFH